MSQPVSAGHPGCEHIDTFTPTTTVQPEKIKAGYENGVLTITLPKAEAAKPHLIKVDVTPQKALK